MDFMKLFGTVVAVFFHPGSASKINGQRICRRGTERPCYKVSYIQDSRRRLTFEDAGRACRSDGGQLLSIETESEQRLVERFIRQLQAADGDFWIGLRRSPQRLRPDTSSPGCPSQYYWLDGSRAKFRNWHWDEPSCGGEMCVVLYYQPSAPPDEEGHFLFQWNDDNCNSKNNYVCKYAEENVPAFTEDGNRERAAPTGGPAPFSTTQSDGRMGLESSVSLSDDTLYASYILYAAIPALLLLLLLLLAAAGFFCYKRHAKRKKTEAAGKSCRAKPWMVAAASPGPAQGPYAFSDVTKLPPTTSALADIMRAYSCAADDYENVPGADRATDSVSNDIYEMCRAQSHSGWVENEIYG